MIVHIILIFLFCQNVSTTDIDFEAVMITNIIRTMERPSTVIATLCWPVYKKVNLYSLLAGNNTDQLSMLQFVEYYNIARYNTVPQYTTFFVDLNCPNITEYFQQNMNLNFGSPFRWFLIDGKNNKNEIANIMGSIDILPDSEVTIIRKIDNDTYKLDLIYKINNGGIWRSESYGIWNKDSNFKIADNMVEAPALRRLNLDGFEISICYVLTDNDSVNHLTDEVNDHIDTITKVNFPTTNHLLDFLNASRKYIYVNTWGYHVNGTWNGMTGYLVREEVEIGGSPMFLTSERIPVVEYISSPTPTRSKFVFQQPKLSYESNLFLLSFRNTVWYSSIALLLLLLLALFAVAIWEWNQTKHTSISGERDSGILRPNFADIVILILGVTCQQGSPVELKGSLGRIVLLILFLAVMFLYTSYSANIVALLQSSSSKINSLDDLLHSRLKFGVHDNVFNRYYFSTATEPVRKAIYEKKVAPPGTPPRFMTMEEGVKNIRKGLFAFHMETGVGYKFVGKYFQESEKCGLKEIQYLQVIDPWLAVRKNTPYKEMFKIGMKRIQEHGLQSRENRLLYERRPKCSGSETSFVSVSMVDCYPALLILSYGTLMAVGLMMIENGIYCRQNIIKKIQKTYKRKNNRIYNSAN
ncbi:ionotropic receptor 75a-like [Achroia grisella]|uniref:ionotropic receptor 75a-like n=1 Tax=Achroia grisella TaxID=688607 RepID=UPI0027D2D189|nr:ionotropic receptor 75a-like [Achroia grisella]